MGGEEVEEGGKKRDESKIQQTLLHKVKGRLDMVKGRG